MLAGAIAGGIEHMFTYPIDTIKTHMQARANVYNAKQVQVNELQPACKVATPCPSTMRPVCQQSLQVQNPPSVCGFIRQFDNPSTQTQKMILAHPTSIVKAPTCHTTIQKLVKATASCVFSTQSTTTATEYVDRR
uniref:Mitoferrin n=1 Tax=Lygus hesperus TaxID=30085 RepID=A0A0A9XZM8_LYGHE